MTNHKPTTNKEAPKDPARQARFRSAAGLAVGATVGAAAYLAGLGVLGVAATGLIAASTSPHTGGGQEP